MSRDTEQALEEANSAVKETIAALRRARERRAVQLSHDVVMAARVAEASRTRAEFAKRPRELEALSWLFGLM